MKKDVSGSRSTKCRKIKSGTLLLRTLFIATATRFAQTAFQHMLHLLEESTPDGSYPYQPGNSDIVFRDIALPLGACASPWRNPDGQPLFDCDYLAENPR